MVEAARGYLGTPFHHQGRARGVGVDCIGLLVGAARDAGLPVSDVIDYARDPDGRSLIVNLRAQLDEVRFDDAQPGDVLAFWFARPYLPQHVAIKTERGMIHTYANVGRVVEHRLAGPWRKRAHSAWRFRRAL